MKKLYVISTLFVITCFQLNAQNPAYAWALQMKDVPNAYYSVKTDAQNNAYVIGEYQSTTDFDPSAATVAMTTRGSVDMFIAKYDYHGNFLWVRSMGGKQSDQARSLTLDANGNAYISGAVSDTVYFQTATSTMSFAAGPALNAFIAKYDANGNYIWADVLNGSGYATPTDINFSPSGHIYLSGEFYGNIDFDPSSSVANLPVLGATNNNLFVAKYDLNGNYIWAKSMEGAGGVYLGKSSISTDPSENSYISGVFAGGTLDFDPSATATATVNMPASSAFAYIAKYDASGNYTWVKYLGTNTNADITPYDITVDATGNSYITGNVGSACDMDPSASTVLLTGANGDMFIAKYDMNGNYVWAKNMGGTSYEEGDAIDIDNSANIYITGFCQGNGDYDPSAAVYNLTAVGSYNVVMAKYTNAGGFVWAANMGGVTSAEQGGGGYAIDIGVNGSVYVSGGFRGTMDFDPSATATASLTAGSAFGYADLFLARYNQCTTATSSTITISSCNTYSLNGQSYTSSGTYTQFLTNTAGCDSILTLNLSIKQPTSKSITQSTCNQYILNAQTYTTSGVYTQTLTNAAGCDSIITIHLTIKQITSNTITQIACSNYTLNAQTYTASGVYTQTLTNSVGCDSIITLNLTINTVDNTVTQNGIILTANETGATYQWLNCNTGNSAIPTATAQTYTATINDSYAVIVTKAGCSNTSSCVVISSVGIDEQNNLYELQVYPNPSSSMVNISSNQSLENVEVKLYNVTGELLPVTVQIQDKHLSMDISEYRNGLYILQITQHGHDKWIKLVKD